MGKGKTPDYAAAAQKQGAANRETALAEFQLNNSNQNTPWGSQTLTKGPGGDTDYTRTVTLNPQDQALLDQQRAAQSSIMGAVPNVLNNVWGQIGQAPQTGNLPPMSYGVDAGGTRQLDLSGAAPLESGNDVRNRVENASFNKFYDRFAPAAQQQQNTMNTRIANMGGVTTSDAAQRMMGGLLTNQGDQMRQGVFDSILTGGQEAERQFGMGLQGHQQGVSDITAQTGFNNAANQQDVTNAFANANLANASRNQGMNEMAQLRQMPLNELMAMLGGTQVNSPQFQPMQPTNIQPAPIMQGAVAQGQANSASQGSTLGALGTLGGAAIKAGLFSDRRLKTNIRRVGTTPGGHAWYEYDIFGRRERGVMAQELLLKNPAAVSIHPSGYYMVDYSQVE